MFRYFADRNADQCCDILQTRAAMQLCVMRLADRRTGDKDPCFQFYAFAQIDIYMDNWKASIVPDKRSARTFSLKLYLQTASTHADLQIYCKKWAWSYLWGNYRNENLQRTCPTSH